ncbi:MAG TPA: hypothetical protein DCG34_08845 [Clostridiales bacterium]|jgi:hypothetical protein|nr:hypothetical protein [Clostridiales bacterium]
MTDIYNIIVNPPGSEAIRVFEDGENEDFITTNFIRGVKQVIIGTSKGPYELPEIKETIYKPVNQLFKNVKEWTCTEDPFFGKTLLIIEQ